MKNKIVYKYIGKVLIVFSFLLSFPIIISLIYNEPLFPFLVPQLISLSLGIVLNSINTDSEIIYAKDGFEIVAISWIIISIIGAIPLYINGDASFIDSIFETVSGFTTTGATIFKNVETLNKSILFWRSFSHFIGGMGVLTFVMVIVPLSRNDKSMHLLKAEMPGPSVGKLVPSIKKTLIYLYGIYLYLTLLEIILLLFGGMDLFTSTLISFSTAGTGGFSILNTSLATYPVFCKYIVAVFMLLFGVNFNIYFLVLMGKFKSALKSEELRVYIFIYVFAVIFVFLNTITMFNSISEAFLESTFHISSIMTSTGFSIGNINIYPTSSRVLCLILMIISACAGSTCGGIKVSRLIIAFKTIKRELKKLIHPNSVQVIVFEGKKVSDEIVRSSNTFLFLYAILIILIIFIVGFDGFSIETTINAVFTTFANVGLSFNISNFAEFSILSKIVLSIGMLLGRLEIFPILVLFTDWKRK